MTSLGAALDSYDVPYTGRDAESVPLPRSSREDRPTFPVELTAVEIRDAHADVSLEDLLLTGASASTATEVDYLAVVATLVLPHTLWFTPFVDQAGNELACFHSQLAAWRRSPGGLSTIETHAAARLTRGRPRLSVIT